MTKLTNQGPRRKWNWSDTCGSSLVKTDVSRWGYKNKRRINSLLTHTLDKTSDSDFPDGIQREMIRNKGLQEDDIQKIHTSAPEQLTDQELLLSSISESDLVRKHSSGWDKEYPKCTFCSKTLRVWRPDSSRCERKFSIDTNRRSRTNSSQPVRHPNEVWQSASGKVKLSR